MTATRGKLAAGILLALAVVCTGTAAHGAPAPAAVSPGVVVVSLTPFAEVRHPDLAEGDRLTAWRPSASPDHEALPLETVFDFHRLEIEEAPHGALAISVSRGQRRLTAALTGIQWGVGVRPDFGGPTLERYESGRRALEDGDAPAAAAQWTALAEELDVADDPIVRAAAAWLWSEAGALAPGADAGLDRFRRALAAAEPLGDSVTVALWEMRARSLEASSASAAADAWRQVIDRREDAGADALGLAHALYMLGTVAGRGGDLAVADQHLARALEIRRRLAPGSLVVAESLTALGIDRALRGDLDGAGARFQEALEVARATDPQSGEAAAAYNALGNVAQRRGRLRQAGDYYRQALTINRRYDPGGLNVSFQLNNLGFVAESLGDLAAAEDYYRQALDIRRRRAPGTLHEARAIDNLAFVAFGRGDLTRADDLHREALRLYERLAPASLVVSTSLKLLGHVNLARGDLAQARDDFERARRLEADIAPDTLSYAEILDGLGRVAAAGDERGEARRLHEQALSLREAVAPGSLDVAASLEALGDLAARDGDAAAAETRYRSAVELRSRLAPGTASHAEALHALGSILRDTGRPADALDYYRRALDALETQRGRLGGTEEVRTRFAARYGYLYRDYIDLLLQRDDPDTAFDVLERYRARGLLALLAERDLLLEDDLPADLAERRRQLNQSYDDVSAALAALADTPAHATEIADLLTRLRALKSRRQRLTDTIRAVSPRLAAARSPRPLTLAEVARTLPPRTVLLSYAVGTDDTRLFVLRAGGTDPSARLTVFSVALGEAALTRQVEAVRLLTQVPGAGDDSARALAERSHALYEALVAPAADAIAGAERLLVIPDGPLHLLPFAALVTTTGDRPRYLVEQIPLYSAVSATVHAELRHAGDVGPPPSGRFVGFADPSPAALAKAGASTAAGRGAGPLPYARREVEAIARLYPGASDLYVGDAASEARAKALDRTAQFLHFASHGVLDARFPLDSHLVLAPDQGPRATDNGMLQAWEIFEQMRIDADLVTLSTCDSALGSPGGGEGLVGLTRAFQYAGARSVLASLWPVSDRSTSLLMERFYAHLRAGEPKAEALRAAQLELIDLGRHPGWPATLSSWLNGASGEADLAHPYHWAAFTLHGDAG